MPNTQNERRGVEVPLAFNSPYVDDLWTEPASYHHVAARLADLTRV
jgi:hypothetical protein